MGKRTWVSEQLVDAAKRGDVESISAVVYGAHPHVRRFAQSMCASPQDAEDAAQEALIILYRKIGSLRASSALASWIFRIVRNECLRLSRLLLRQPTEPVETTPTQSAEDEVFHRLEAERVARAIAS